MSNPQNSQSRSLYSQADLKISSGTGVNTKYYNYQNSIANLPSDSLHTTKALGIGSSGSANPRPKDNGIGIGNDMSYESFLAMVNQAKSPPHSTQQSNSHKTPNHSQSKPSQSVASVNDNSASSLSSQAKSQQSPPHVSVPVAHSTAQLNIQHYKPTSQDTIPDLDKSTVASLIYGKKQSSSAKISSTRTTNTSSSPSSSASGIPPIHSSLKMKEQPTLDLITEQDNLLHQVVDEIAVENGAIPPSIVASVDTGVDGATGHGSLSSSQPQSGAINGSLSSSLYLSSASTSSANFDFSKDVCGLGSGFQGADDPLLDLHRPSDLSSSVLQPTKSPVAVGTEVDAADKLLEERLRRLQEGAISGAKKPTMSLEQRLLALNMASNGHSQPIIAPGVFASKAQSLDEDSDCSGTDTDFDVTDEDEDETGDGDGDENRKKDINTLSKPKSKSNVSLEHDAALALAAAQQALVNHSTKQPHTVKGKTPLAGTETENDSVISDADVETLMQQYAGNVSLERNDSQQESLQNQSATSTIQLGSGPDPSSSSSSLESEMRGESKQLRDLVGYIYDEVRVEDELEASQFQCAIQSTPAPPSSSL